MGSGLRGAWVAGGSVGAFASAAMGDPIPVLTVSVHDRGPSAAQVASAVGAVGADAQSGEALRRELLARFGRYAPPEDVLAAQRAAIAQGETAMFGQSYAAGRRRLQPAVAAMEAAPDALELQQNNRAAYLKALFLLARIAYEERHADEAEALLRRAFAFDPWWMPSDYDCPVRFRPFVARLRPPAVAGAPGGSGTLSVRAPREGCTVSVDDERSASTAQTVEQATPAGGHRVSVRCGEVSRVRAVTIAPGRTTSLAPDPRLDALLRVAELPGLNYPTAPESTAVVISDGAAVGATLGAARVVLVTAERPLVVDVRRGELAHDALAAQVERALGAGGSTPAPASAVPPIDPRVDVRPAAPTRGPGAGPWVLVGAGVAALGAGGAFLALRGGALDNAEAVCPGLVCTRATEATGAAYRDDAALYTTLAIASGSVGVLAIAGGVVWYALAPRRATSALRVSPWSNGTASGLTLDARF